MLAAHAADTAAPQKKVATPAAKKTALAPKTAAHKTPVASKTTPTSRPASAKPPVTGAARTTTAARRTTAAPRRPTTTWRNRQAVPTTDRYKEIQNALAAKGYLQSEDATGKWDQTSIDALKRFQTEQKLESTGKINSLSLIALGLGPKYEAAAPAKPGDPPGGPR